MTRFAVYGKSSNKSGLLFVLLPPIYIFIKLHFPKKTAYWITCRLHVLGAPIIFAVLRILRNL